MAKRHVMPRIYFAWDGGHSRWKYGVREENGEWFWADTTHSQHTIERKRWEQITEQAAGSGVALDYVQCGQDFYVMGESGERVGFSTRLYGASRYARNYIGVQAMSMLARITPYPEAEVVMIAMYPPGDDLYREELRRALIGTWDLMLGDGSEYLFHVKKVVLTAEPVAGLRNVALNNRLQEDRRVTSAETLVLDVGGGTTSGAPVFAGGGVDYQRAFSFNIGILKVMDELDSLLKSRYRDMLRQTRFIQPHRLREMLATNVFRGGGRSVNCAEEVRAAKRMLLERIERMYFDGTIGGAFAFDQIILTGGGSIALGDDLVALLNHKNVIYAGEAVNIHMANVYGAAKMLDILAADGAFDE